MIAKAGVVAYVDTLAVLRDEGMWRRGSGDGDGGAGEELSCVLPRPKGFALSGESRECFDMMRPDLKTYGTNLC